jgi:hypothetical protein
VNGASGIFSPIQLFKTGSPEATGCKYRQKCGRSEVKSSPAARHYIEGARLGRPDHWATQAARKPFRRGSQHAPSGSIHTTENGGARRRGRGLPMREQQGQIVAPSFKPSEEDSSNSWGLVFEGRGGERHYSARQESRGLGK